MADHPLSLMLPEFAGFFLGEFRQSWLAEHIGGLKKYFPKMKNEKKIASDSCFMNPRNSLGGRNV